ncbi:hypothetical protein [Hansschlegelia sp.]|uniref:hypothetical protein n=1 Tax=Hansschlegelia sp. TaxID=2041892 RepID=UPI002BF5CAF1|nr:hypothetical protein [Hansschlegelia sp.]HVI28067.1 hypothetical protein [Hansschlegelia sp.]
MAGRSPHPRRSRYGDRSGASGVVAYATGDGFIDLWFRDGGGYRYDATAPGPEHVAAMTRLAAAGEGLATYVNQHVRANYARKL